ncbi:fumarylacetoacetate hydrolase family protein [Azoarcus sp. L1K30]|uniref:2-keto-4-pentenoate hydratase n=1 Tax=Azoarcus sp. L1K30 TaxID=2820277 RepID=UPI001B820429|nr:fumarylacetoacetate hydrolase family protein [Azoarcus sp. L1K30]MBR0566838.1 fumarylacetoacetate hydrolase family protein [Azoarcus sp. L1K30]
MIKTGPALADALIRAWHSGQPLDSETATRLAPPDPASAYRIQRQVGDALGWFPGGRPKAWKIGAASRESLPTAAPIADRAVIASPARFDMSGCHTMIGIEVELAIRLARPLGAGSSAADVRSAIGSVMAAIEICDVRASSPAWSQLPPLFRLADQQMNRCLLLAPPAANVWPDDCADIEVRLEINGQDTLRQRGGHPLVDPLYRLPWLAEHVANEYPQGLQAGDIITTGTWTGLYEARPGDHIRASFAGFGEVELKVAA